MSKLASIAFSAAIALAPVLIFAQAGGRSSGGMGQSGPGSFNNSGGTSPSNPSNMGDTGTGQITPNTGNTGYGAGTSGGIGTGETGNGNLGSRSLGSGRTSNRTMPSTSVGWLPMLLSGSSLSGMGLALRRLRNR